jgi:exosortase
MLKPANRTISQQAPMGWTYPLVGAILVLHLPLLLKLAQRLWATDHYQFFPLVVGGAGYFVYQRTKGYHAIPGSRPWRLLLTANSLLLLTLAILLNSPWLGSISMMTSLWSIAYILGGRELFRRVRPVWLALWLTVPLPLGLDLQLIQMLQRVATQRASGLLDLVGIRHVVSGVLLELPEKTFLVEEACSGIHSLFAALSCTAFYLIYAQRHFVRSTLLIVSTVFWVLVTNVGRVTTVAILGSRWNLPVTEGLTHAMLGTVFFAACLGLILSTDRMLLFFMPIRLDLGLDMQQRQRFSWRRLLGLKPRKKRDVTSPTIDPRPAVTSSDAPAGSPEVSEQPSRKLPQPVRRPEAIVVVVVCTLLLLFQLVRPSPKAVADDDRLRIENLRSAAAEDLPHDVNGWERQEFESLTRDADDPNGQYTRIWRYGKGNRVVAVSIDGPFIGWHNLAGCLEGQGWSISSTEHYDYQEIGEDQAGGFSEMKIQKGMQQYAYVLFAVFDEQHRPLAPSETYVQFRAVRRFPKVSELFKQVTGGAPAGLAADDSQTYQVLLFAEGLALPSDRDRDELRNLFHALRRQITTDHQRTELLSGN